MSIKKQELSLLGLLQLMLLVQMLVVNAFSYYMAYRTECWQWLMIFSIGFAVNAFGVLLCTIIKNRKSSNP